MPDLPTLTINNQVTYDRVVAAFNSSPAEYRIWLRQALKSEVIRRECETIRTNFNNQISSLQTEIGGIIDGA